MDISKASPAAEAAWLRSGFRPFFLAAGGYAVVAMLVWYLAFANGWQFPFGGLTAVNWHAHEMVYGYGMAVVAGFLLTAVNNWTGIATLRGLPLLLLFVCWLLARVMLLVGSAVSVVVAASFDLLFIALLAAALAMPIVQSRNWLNLAIVAKILLLLLSNLVFYLGVAGVLEQGVFLGLYSGVYLLMALIFTLSRRVLPFFIERGVGYPVELYNNKIIDITSLVLFIAFWVAELFSPDGLVVALLSLVLFSLHLIRLSGWHTPGIWKKPLLWVLYLAYLSLTAGFALKAAVYFTGLSPYLALHAFTVGGIGLMTLGMMSRVALGHSGRNVFEPPAVLNWIFLLLLSGVIFRVVLPLLAESRYLLWVGWSQWLWIFAFLVFFIVYLPVLTRPRVDGKEG